MVEHIKESILTKAKYLPEKQIERLKTAISFSEKAHLDQKRATGEPYIIHPLTVCEILLDYKADITTLISSLLHDVVEDTVYTITDISSKFGSQVALIVEGLTKVEKGNFKKEEYSAINKEKLLFASEKDVRVAVIKIADRLHNMRTLAVKRVEKKVPYANETLIFFSPLAERLGLYEMQKELEKLGFSYLNNTMYKRIKNLINNYNNVFMPIFNKALTNIEKAKINTPIKVNWDLVPIYKSYSLIQEEYSLSELYTIRVTTDSVMDCYTTLGIIHTLFEPIQQKFEDNIALQKSPFLRQLKTKVLIDEVEVDITIQSSMDEKIKKLGVFSLVKGDLTNEEVKKIGQDLFGNSINSVKAISNNSIEFYDLISYEMLQQEITVFTPKMDIIKLPEGSTPIDFAFYLNPSLATKMAKVKVNGKVTPFYTVLNDMDIIEIKTANKLMIEPQWLNFARTSNAIKEINKLLSI